MDVADHRGVTALPRWFGPPEAPTLGWVSVAGRPSGAGVVVVPPVGYEYWTAHRTLRSLAEVLAAAGAMVLRYDHPGTGDAAGSPLDADPVAGWRAGVRSAAEQVRELGCERVYLVGLRLGASLALLEAEACGATGVAALAPVVRGRQLVRELRLLGTEVPAGTAGYPDGSLAVAGTVFTPAVTGELAVIDLREAVPGVGDVLVIDQGRSDAAAAMGARLAAAGVTVRCEVDRHLDACLSQPTEYATVPASVLASVARWYGSVEARRAPGAPVPTAPPGGATRAARPGPVTLPAAGCSEEAVELAGLRAILCEPLGRRRATVVLLNPGSEAHVGPGRAWVEYARQLAGHGYASVRADFSGWGESPDRGHAPGRPYDQHGVAEAGAIVGALRDAGHGAPVLLGLCAGAWIALRAAPEVDGLAGVVALNPQLYWQPGDPVEADIVGETHVRRLPEITHQHRLGRLGVWDALDVVGARHPAARWLDQLAAGAPPVLMAFADGDDGLAFLEDRVGRAWRRATRGRRVTLARMPGIDHPMHRHWLRPVVTAAVVSWLDRTV